MRVSDKLTVKWKRGQTHLHLLIKQTLKKYSALFLLNRLGEDLQNITEGHMINFFTDMKDTNEPAGKHALCYLHSYNHSAINKGHQHALLLGKHTVF